MTPEKKFVSHRGKAIQPDRNCDFCNKQLPALRHPKAKYCDTICRGRDRWQREHVGEGVKCLVCGKLFNRVGSHVVQSHGYESVDEYKYEFGLTSRETHTEEHIELMRGKVTDKAIDNLRLGEDMRFRKGGDHAEKLREFWHNRKTKRGFEQLRQSRGENVK